VSAIFIRFINRLVPHLPKSFPEGSSSWVLQTFFERLLRENRHIAAIAETGFNTGVSSRAFLSARPDTTVVSFDIGDHPWVRSRKAAIDHSFPRRHELVLGDSRDTLRAYAAKHPGTRFDLVFIDGGHEYDVARADLLNFRAMSHDHTVVVMDDLTPWLEWGRGPSRAWHEALQAGLVVQEGLYQNGQPVKEPTGRRFQRIWALGRYCELQLTSFPDFHSEGVRR